MEKASFIMKAKKILCFLLVFVLCFVTLAGCKGGNGKTPDSTPSQGNNTQEDTDPSLVNDLKEYYDFGNEEFTILARTETSYEFAETGTGSFVEEAVVGRNYYVMEHCNVEISVKTRMGNWNNRDTFITAVRNNSAMGDSVYDLVATHSGYLLQLAVEGLGQNLAELPNINFTKRWWSEQYYEVANYNGAMYIAFGDIAYSLYEYLMVFFYNERLANDYNINDSLAEEYGVDSLYELALNGDWTFEKLMIYTQYITTDPDSANPVYGLLENGHGTHAYVSSFGLELVPLIGGVRTISPSIPESLFTPMNRVIQFLQNTESVRIDFTEENSVNTQNPIFVAGRSLFYQQKLGQATYFKAEMEDGYGVLPYPKYDDNQLVYHTDYCDDLTAIMIPKNVRVSDLEMIGTVTEMLCMESYRSVVNQFYEKTLKYQSFQNPLCVDTLELIRTSFSPTFAKVFTVVLGTPASILGNTVETKGNLSSYWTAHVSDWQTQLKKLFANLDKIAAA